MLILAIETSTISCSVALLKDGCVMAEVTTQRSRNHSSTLMPNIKKLFEIANVSAKELNAVAVSSGPGSFTGLRIGMTTAKALSYALNIRLVLVPTLEVLAASCFAGGEYVLSLIDAQQQKAYCAVYKWNSYGLLEELVAVELVNIAGIMQWIKKLNLNRSILITGEVNLIPSTIEKEWINENVYVNRTKTALPVAASVAFLAQQKLLKNETEDCSTAKPFYIRVSAAEEKLKTGMS